MPENPRKSRLLLSLFCSALLLGVSAASLLSRPALAQGGGNPVSGGGTGEVIADAGFEAYVDVPDTQVDPPMVAESLDEPGELDYLIPEEDTSGDDEPWLEEIEIDRSQVTPGGTGTPH